MSWKPGLAALLTEQLGAIARLVLYTEYLLDLRLTLDATVFVIFQYANRIRLDACLPFLNLLAGRQIMALSITYAAKILLTTFTVDSIRLFIDQNDL